MLLFDLLDYIIFLIIRLLPILITIISVFIAYYFYKINSKVNIEKFKNNYLIDIKELCKDRPVLCDNLIYNRFLKKEKNINQIIIFVVDNVILIKIMIVYLN